MRKSELEKAIAALTQKRDALDLAIAALRAQATAGPRVRETPRRLATTAKESA